MHSYNISYKPVVLDSANTVYHTVNELKFGIQADNTNMKVEFVDRID